MQLLPLDQFGPREIEDQPGVVLFGLFLPWVSAVDGNRLYLQIIHEQDQFLQQIQPLEFELSPSSNPIFGDYWSVEVNIANHPPPHPQLAWGSAGRYISGYCPSNTPTSGPIELIIDPSPGSSASVNSRLSFWAVNPTTGSGTS